MNVKQFLRKRGLFLRDLKDLTASYCPAVAVSAGKKFLFISGEVAFEDRGKVVGQRDIVAQVRKIFENLRVILNKAGADFKDVVKTNYYITNVSQFPGWLP